MAARKVPLSFSITPAQITTLFIYRFNSVLLFLNGKGIENIIQISLTNVYFFKKNYWKAALRTEKAIRQLLQNQCKFLRHKY